MPDIDKHVCSTVAFNPAKLIVFTGYLLARPLQHVGLHDFTNKPGAGDVVEVGEGLGATILGDDCDKLSFPVLGPHLGLGDLIED